MREVIIREFVGSTLRATFVCSGATVSPLWSNLIDRAGAVVSSAAAVSSGNGHYYTQHSLPNSAQWMVAKWSGVIDSSTYVRFALVNVRNMEVD